MHLHFSQEPFNARIYRKNAAPRPEQPRYPHFAQACTVEMHMDMFTGKMPAPEVSRTFCASLRSRNALGHLTRAILCENVYTGKMPQGRKAMEHPDLTSALTPTVRTPQCGHTVTYCSVLPSSRPRLPTTSHSKESKE